MNKYFFSHGRTALKFGLKQLGFKSEEEILIPDFICDVVVNTLKTSGIKYKYYYINDKLEPDWGSLTSLINKNSRGILMVHYFGQPQDIKRFKSFCKKFNLLLIEDNAHGYGGSINDRFLGTFGDCSIGSPRKTMNVASGGVLFFKEKNKISMEKIPIYKPKFTKKIMIKTFNNFPSIKAFVRKKIKSRPKFEDPSFFREPDILDYQIDEWSEKIIINKDLKELRINRNEKYKYWENFALKNGLNPLYEKLQPNLNPWCFPAYTKNHFESIEWFKWGWEKNINIFSWPNLPEEILNKNDHCIKRWEKLVCFGLD